MCDVVMCEDIAGYYKRASLFILSPHSRALLPFLQYSSEAQPDQPRSFLPT